VVFLILLRLLKSGQKHIFTPDLIGRFTSMALNLELKIKPDDFSHVRKKLISINAEYKGVLNQRDVYYSSIAGLLKLRTVNGKQELIRYDRNEDEGNRFSDYDILVINAPGAEEFFNAILPVKTIVEKKRELYLYDNTRIHIDDVKDLGSFLELETLVLFGKDDAEKRFNTIVKLLELDLSKQIKASYKNLMDEKKKK
jgi:adenylate cyclase class 2